MSMKCSQTLHRLLEQTDNIFASKLLLHDQKRGKPMTTRLCKVNAGFIIVQIYMWGKIYTGSIKKCFLKKILNHKKLQAKSGSRKMEESSVPLACLIGLIM